MLENNSILHTQYVYFPQLILQSANSMVNKLPNVIDIFHLQWTGDDINNVYIRTEWGKKWDGDISHSITWHYHELPDLGNKDKWMIKDETTQQIIWNYSDAWS